MELLTQKKSGRGVKLSTHHLVLRLRMMELYLDSPIYFYGVVLNYLSPRLSLP
jgi:hypothetical protein